ncbi:MAG TPA: hypothetical protein VNV82_00735 [Bryobacteraceae bacterium]|nr:hypothetical protein [Bryobacteraceae bacterium]
MIISILNLVFYGVTIWISQKSKPLGNMPYRWGVYVGMITGWMSLPLIVSSVPALVGGHLLGGSVLFIDALLAAVASFGILRRRKLGVVSLGLAYAVLILIAPYLASMPDWPFLFVISDQPSPIIDLARQAMSFPWVISLGFTAAYLVCTFVYFKNRWEWMQPPKSA